MDQTTLRLLAAASANATPSDPRRIQASDASASDEFGYSVAISGDGTVMAVGARNDTNSGGAGAGSVYVYTRNGTVWTEQARVQASDAAAGDSFGCAVALSSDANTMAVGAYNDTNSGGANAGSVYIFTRTGSTWTQQTRLQASNAAATDYFGWSVSLSADGALVAIGAYQRDLTGASNAGLVYVFTRSTATWTQQTTLQASDAATEDWFGSSIAISADGNYLAVGSVKDDNSGGTDAGSVYVFSRSSGTWNTTGTRLQASDAAATDAFGSAVALSANGSTLAVGANKDDNSGGTDAGSVYIFTRSGSTWTQQTRLQASDAAANDYFGSAVALSATGNTLAVGSSGDDNSGGSDSGSVYLFTRSGSTWTQQSMLVPTDGSTGDSFGNAVALSLDGNVLAVGSVYDDNSGGNNAGSVYTFTDYAGTDSASWVSGFQLYAPDAAASDYFGLTPAFSGDGNTLAIGSYRDDNSGGTDAGSVYIFTRSAGVWAFQARLQASDAAANDYFGSGVSLSYDGNTAAIGAQFDDNSGGSDAGSVYIFTRTGSTWTQQTRLQASDAAANDYFGLCTALSSDGNTLAVGAPYDDNSSGTDAGSAYIFTRSGSSWSQQTKIVSASVSGIFGQTLSLSADGNTVAIGAPFDANTRGSTAGSVAVYTRSGTTWSSQADLFPSDLGSSDYFGYSVSLSSDGNTLIAGARLGSPSGISGAGAAYVYTRSGTSWSQQQKLVASDAAASDSFGFSVSLAADGNTALIGAWLDDNTGGSDTGSLYVFTRSGTTWTQQAKVVPADAGPSDNLGVRSAISPDGTMIVGAAYVDDATHTDQGSVTIRYKTRI